LLFLGVRVFSWCGSLANSNNQKGVFPMKRVVVACFALALVACGGGGGGSDGGSTAPASLPAVNFTGSDQAFDITRPDKYDLNITGSRNSITFGPDTLIGDINLVGSNNLLTFDSGVSVDFIGIVGDDNTFSVPTGTAGSFDSVVGSGNAIIEY
jgi:xanthine dehydrogenase molybdopterin-binding subunit B